MVIPHTGSSTSAGAPPSCASVECVWWSVIVAIQGTNSAPRPALLHVLSRIGVELRLAHLRAEVIGLALILAGRRGLRRLDLHAAHGIFFHQTLLDSVYLIGASAPSGHRAIGSSGHRGIGASSHRVIGSSAAVAITAAVLGARAARFHHALLEGFARAKHAHARVARGELPFSRE